jgi:hypothetical protein
MLRSVRDLENYAVNTTDGEVGHIKDFYFDDHAWVIRYLVVNAGSWFSSREVLISPLSVIYPLGSTGSLSLSISSEQVKHSPGIDSDKPVSRQNEAEYLRYLGYPIYWGGGGIWGSGMYPFGLTSGGDAAAGQSREQRDRDLAAYRAAERNRHRNDDPNLRSCKVVTGYHVHAFDGEIGHISGLLVDDETWALRYIVVGTGHWWAGQEVLIPPQWFTGVDWLERTACVDVSRESVKQAPPYSPLMPWDRDAERSLYRHYGRTGYWAEPVALESQV